MEAVWDVAPVWSGHHVRFFLLTEAERQYVAFYDRNREMTVAMRTVDSDKWRYHKLGSKVGWDSHNYITMAIDTGGHLHLSGNMHGDPLVYYRTAEPYDIETFERINLMMGRREQRCTYPRFIKGPDGELVFMYRDGGSGNGRRIFNVYDPTTHSWRRLLEKPFLEGQGRMNAYPVGPVRGPDGYFHLCWVWRNTPDCCTNHDLCYARSRDLVHWETVAGDPVELPMTVASRGTIVDPVPARGGMINGNTKIGFDSKWRPIVSYHKFDGQGMTQVYNARFEGGKWRIRRASDWDYRWWFEGGGTIHFEMRVGGVTHGGDGSLVQSYQHDKYGSGVWKLDEATLRPIGKATLGRQWPVSLDRSESGVEGMLVHWLSDAGGSGEQGVNYALRWETLGVNRDRPRTQTPQASMLRVYKLRYE